MDCALYAERRLDSLQTLMIYRKTRFCRTTARTRWSGSKAWFLEYLWNPHLPSSRSRKEFFIVRATVKLILNHTQIFDVVRRKHSTLDVLQECRMDYQESRTDYHWNVDVDQQLSRPWTSFTQCSLLNNIPSQGHVWSGKRLTKIQASFRAEYIWPESWSFMSKADERRENQHWPISHDL